MVLHLDRVPVRESGMTPYEIMLSESQERMLVVCEPKAAKELEAVFAKWDLHAVQIGFHGNPQGTGALRTPVRKQDRRCRIDTLRDQPVAHIG